jgi:hypothetical protein
MDGGSDGEEDGDGVGWSVGDSVVAVSVGLRVGVSGSSVGSSMGESVGEGVATGADAVGGDVAVGLVPPWHSGMLQSPKMAKVTDRSLMAPVPDTVLQGINSSCVDGSNTFWVAGFSSE